MMKSIRSEAKTCREIIFDPYISKVRTKVPTMAPNISAPANDIQHHTTIFHVLGQVASFGCLSGLSIRGKVMFKMNHRCQDKEKKD